MQYLPLLHPLLHQHHNMRCIQLNTLSNSKKGYVAYVMQRDVRIQDNFALYYAQKYALSKKLPLLIIYDIGYTFSLYNEHQKRYLLQSIQQIHEILLSHQVDLLIIKTYNGDKFLPYLEDNLPVVCWFFDYNPLTEIKNIYKQFTGISKNPIYLVDAHNIIPVWDASEKQEWAAYTIRPKILKKLHIYLQKPPQLQIHPYRRNNILTSNPFFDIVSIKSLAQSYPTKDYANLAENTLSNFINNKLKSYNKEKNIYHIEGTSRFSEYLHHGTMWVGTVALEILSKYDHIYPFHEQFFTELFDKKLDINLVSYLEELIIRRELAENYCHYNSHYKEFDGLPNWAQKTLKTHINDKRDYIYSYEEFAEGKTHDDEWNIAQRTLVNYGYMHGYMRMYWAKKILEWSSNPVEALNIAIKLNDAFAKDGNEPSGYVGIMWSIGGLHDRPWFERNIFGLIRYMSGNALKKYKKTIDQ